MASSNGFRQWWRWPLIPFASLIGALLGAAIITGLNWLMMKWHGGYSEDGWFYLYIKPIFHSATFGFLFAWIAGYVAPTGKMITAVVMTTIMGVIGLILLTLGWKAPATTTAEGIGATIGLIAAMGGAIMAVIATKGQEEADAMAERYREESVKKFQEMVAASKTENPASSHKETSES